MTDWNELISDVVAGHWKDPATAKTATVPFEVIRIEDDLDGGEADMLAPLKLGKRIAVVSDVNTHEAMGRRVAYVLEVSGLAADDRAEPHGGEAFKPHLADDGSRGRNPIGTLLRQFRCHAVQRIDRHVG